MSTIIQKNMRKKSSILLLMYTRNLQILKLKEKARCLHFLKSVTFGEKIFLKLRKAQISSFIFENKKIFTFR